MSIIQVNGKNQEVETPVSLVEVMRINNVTQPEMVSVQVNGEFVSRSEFETVQIHPGDEVDFLYFMGGGSRC
ncbi:MAG: sulfur carrier protein ThiS [Prolixibacteraceae bacterium]